MKQSKKLWWLAFYAVGMAYAESAVVVYLRRIYGITDLIRDGLQLDPTIAPIEVGRELATLVMLLAVGWAAGNTFQARLGFTIFAFGLWDIFYYIWLKVFIDWPTSLFTPDILFLIPLPWWGPVISPILIALLMALAGARLVIAGDRGQLVRLRVFEAAMLVVGASLMLYAFMQDALAILPADTQTLSQLRPTSFNWPVYLIGIGLAAYAIWRIAWRSARRALIG